MTDFSSIQSAIAAALLDGRIRYSSETGLHAIMAERLKAVTDRFVPEFQLSPRDRPDFFWEEKGLVVEAKVDRSANRTIRQLFRYSQDKRVHGIILFRHRPIDIPAQINGKPVGCVEFWHRMI